MSSKLITSMVHHKSITHVPTNLRTFVISSLFFQFCSDRRTNTRTDATENNISFVIMAGPQALNAVCLTGKFYVHWMFDTIGHQYWDDVSIGILPTSLVGCALHLAGEKNFFTSGNYSVAACIRFPAAVALGLTHNGWR